MNDLHEAIDRLIQRQRVKLHRDDDDRTEWHTLPSLWEQLETSIGYSASSGGSGGYKAQSPTSTDVLSLVIEIADAVHEAIKNHDGKPVGHVPGNLRRLATLLTEDGTDELADWAQRVEKWCAKARTALRLDPERPRWIRDTKCPECGADSVSVTKDGERIQQPALAITWTKPDPTTYRGSRDWMVRAVECASCGAVWSRGSSLDALTEQMLKWNTTKETLAKEA